MQRLKLRLSSSFNSDKQETGRSPVTIRETESFFKLLTSPKHASASATLVPWKLQLCRDNELSCTCSAPMYRNLLWIMQLSNVTLPPGRSRSFEKSSGRAVPHCSLMKELCKHKEFHEKHARSESHCALWNRKRTFLHRQTIS